MRRRYSIECSWCHAMFHPWSKTSRLCSFRCANEDKKSRTVDRFLKRVRRTDGCWFWIGGIRKDFGYGRTWYLGRTRGAHVVSYIIHKGPVPDGLFVLHQCDNPICVNPDHLYAGFQRENIRDQIERGRFVFGERNGKASLTADQAAEIRGRYSSGAISHASLASLYRVSRKTIYRVLKGIAYPIERVSVDLR